MMTAYRKMFMIFADFIMTVIATIAIIGLSEIVSLIAGVFMMLYWPFRIRREVNTYHEGSFKKYLKSLFKNNARKKL